MKIRKLAVILNLAFTSSITFAQTNNAIDELGEIILRPSVQTQESSPLDFFSADHKDNGGDGFVAQNGEIVLRDFLRNNYIRKMDATDLFKEFPDIRELFKKIALQVPDAAEMIFEKMTKLEFYFVDGVLPLLPASATGFDIRRADVQIAIKREKKVIISRDAFDRTRDRAYLILHETLHDMVETDEDWSALRHSKVREITNYFKTNIERLDFEETKNLFYENIKMDRYDSFYENDKSVNFDDDVFEGILDESLALEDRCDLYFVESRFHVFTVDNGLLRALFEHAEHCEANYSQSWRLIRTKNDYPELYQYLLDGFDWNQRKFFNIRNVKDLVSEHKYSRDQIIRSCKNYASKGVVDQFNSLYPKVARIKQQSVHYTARVDGLISNEIDEIYYSYIKKNLDLYFNISLEQRLAQMGNERRQVLEARLIDDPVNRIEELNLSAENLRANIKYCRGRVGLRNFYE